MISENTINLLYRHYDNQNVDEFEEDLTRVLFIFRLINRYVNKSETNYKLLINHVIILYNVFGPYAPIALSEYAYHHKNTDITLYLNSVLKFCGRLEEDNEYDLEFYNLLEKKINED